MAPKSLKWLTLVGLANLVACVSALYLDSMNETSSATSLISDFNSEENTIEYFKSNNNNSSSGDGDITKKPLVAQSLLKTASPISDTTSAHSTDYYMNAYCYYEPASGPEKLNKVVCSHLSANEHLPTTFAGYASEVDHLVLVNCSVPVDGETPLVLQSLKAKFPTVSKLSLNACGGSGVLERLFAKVGGAGSAGSDWDQLSELDLSGNQMSDETLGNLSFTALPNLTKLDLSANNLMNLTVLNDDEWKRVKSVDLSENPLDCTVNLDWIQSPGISLVNPNQTLCNRPSHNKPKSIFKVYPLVKKTREECRLNCSCYLYYIWEVGGVVRGRTAVNCSGLGWTRFPDPDLMPQPTATLDMSFNKLENLDDFALDHRYDKLQVLNLYLNDNRIKALSPLEASEWFYKFQTLSLRNNNLTDVPMYALDKLIKQNGGLYKIDLSSNNYKCDCLTISTFKIWLLRNSEYIQHVDDVRCDTTHEQIRHMSMEDWCKPEEGLPFIDELDLVSIAMALLIVIIVCKVYYDYRRYNLEGRLPWLATKL